MLARNIAILLSEKKLSVEEVALFLQKHNLVLLYPQIISFLKRIERKHTSFNTLFIETPFELSEKSLNNIKKYIKDEIKEIEETENKELLSGFLARFKGKEYDASGLRTIEDFINIHHI